MTSERIKILVDDKEHEVIHYDGHGQCVCKSCQTKGKYGVNWTSWMYSIDENSPLMCYHCLVEHLRGNNDG